MITVPIVAMMLKRQVKAFMKTYESVDDELKKN